jgi:Arc/MetJ family transcription regulator
MRPRVARLTSTVVTTKGESMATDYPPATLRVEPSAIPAVHAALRESVRELDNELMLLARDGYIQEPWLGDPESARVVAFYNDRVMSAPDGPYNALVRYRDELIRARDHLAATEAEYRRTEGDNAELWGRRA